MAAKHPPYLLRLKVGNFRSLRDVEVHLRPLNVLVGPNGSGKSNLLDVIAFLGDAVRTDLRPALETRGGFRRVRFRGSTGNSKISIEELREKAARLPAVLRAVSCRGPIRCVFVHEDADDFDPAHLPLIEKIEGTYKSLPWPVHAVVPAWEMETWWFLFPAAVAALHRSWRAPDQYLGKDVGKIRDAKERLRHCVRPAGTRSASFRSYVESDSVLIAQRIVELGLLARPWAAKSASWLAFVDKVARA